METCKDCLKKDCPPRKEDCKKRITLAAIKEWQVECWKQMVRFCKT